MPKLVWDAAGERFYETGVSNGVLYVQSAAGDYPTGIAWNGLTAVNEQPSGAESTALYADNIKYLNLTSVEEFGCTIEAYTYPAAFEQCDGSGVPTEGVSIGQQGRKTFGFAYKTKVGNENTDDLGYKIHVVYGCKASPSERGYATVNDSPEAITFSWEITTTPVAVTGYKPTASITIDSRFCDPDKLALLEAQLFGDAAITANLPSPDEILSIIV